jgi:hypothetical protein
MPIIADGGEIDFLEKRPGVPVGELNEAENFQSTGRAFGINPGGIMLTGGWVHPASQPTPEGSRSKSELRRDCVINPIVVQIDIAIGLWSVRPTE